MKKVINSFVRSCFKILGLAFVLFGVISTEGQCQMIVGDPSLTLNSFGAVKVEVGAGTTRKMDIKEDATTLSINVTPSVLPISVAASSEQIRSEQYFVKATTSLGKFGDIFCAVGQDQRTI